MVKKYNPSKVRTRPSSKLDEVQLEVGLQELEKELKVTRRVYSELDDHITNLEDRIANLGKMTKQ